VILADISSHLSGDLIGDSSVQIDHINTLHEAKEGQLTFVLEKKYISLAQQSSASAFITFKYIDGLANQIIIKNPKKALSQVILLFKKSITESYTKKHNAIISQTSTISTTANLDEGCSVGNNSIISHLVTIGKNCIIGNDVMIYPNVTLYDNTIIGNHVIIHSGAVIGSDGFGYYQDANQWFKVPHIGYVQIDDHVEIGANTCIDRGCIGLTHIMSGCKIDNLVHIAHNTIIEPHVAVAAQVGFTGSTRIGDHVIIGGQAGIDANHIGSHAVIAGKAGVTKDVSENEMVSGFPAWSHKKELKKQAFIRHLMRSHI
tara:strand:+ start:1109 stop:2056 length:948 start_codon:yes stop_codon:yes gene_type:complete